MVKRLNKNLKLVLGLATALVIAGFGVSANARIHRDPGQTAIPQVTLQQIEAGKTFGIKTAPIRIDTYTDFECPHCQALYETVLEPLINDYVSNGKVYLVDHDFPLPMHPYAKIAAYYADAAAAIGRFPQVQQALFVHQAQWAATGKIEPVVAAVLSPAKAKEVEALEKSPVVHAAVQHDVERGQSLGIDETPTMYITHDGHRTPIIGDVSYPILRRYLDALLHQ